jgi:hypothetical protein
MRAVNPIGVYCPHQPSPKNHKKSSYISEATIPKCWDFSSLSTTVKKLRTLQ